jgi:hypothetical protein
MTRQVFDIQGENRGVCVTQKQADYIDGRGDINMMEYDRWSFESDWFTRYMYTNMIEPDMPKEDREDVTWDDMLDRIRKDYPEIDKYNDIWFNGRCIDSRLGGEPMDWQKFHEEWMEEDEDWDMSKMGEMFEDIEVETGDGFMKITGDGMEITMKENEDGSGSMHIILESATKLAASALSLGAALTLF